MSNSRVETDGKNPLPVTLIHVGGTLEGRV